MNETLSVERLLTPKAGLQFRRDESERFPKGDTKVTQFWREIFVALTRFCSCGNKKQQILFGFVVF